MWRQDERISTVVDKEKDKEKDTDEAPAMVGREKRAVARKKGTIVRSSLTTAQSINRIFAPPVRWECWTQWRLDPIDPKKQIQTHKLHYPHIATRKQDRTLKLQ